MFQFYVQHYRIIIHFHKYLSRHARITLDMWAKLHVGHIKYSIFLSGSNKNWNVSTNFNGRPQ